VFFLFPRHPQLRYGPQAGVTNTGVNHLEISRFRISEISRRKKATLQDLLGVTSTYLYLSIDYLNILLFNRG